MGRRRTSLTLASLALLSPPTVSIVLLRPQNRLLPLFPARRSQNSNEFKLAHSAILSRPRRRPGRLAGAPARNLPTSKGNQVVGAPAGPSPSEICWNHPEIPAARVPVDTDERAGSRRSMRSKHLALPFWGLPHRNFRSPRHRLHLLLGDWPYRRWGAPCAG